jgi:hypothetical protein
MLVCELGDKIRVMVLENYFFRGGGRGIGEKLNEKNTSLYHKHIEGKN